jgi:hypothetical protein
VETILEKLLCKKIKKKLCGKDFWRNFCGKNLYKIFQKNLEGNKIQKKYSKKKK